MNRIFSLPLLLLFLGLNNQTLFAQSCGTRQLDPEIAYLLKITNYKDQSLEELRNTPIEKLRTVALPMIPYPQEDVKRIKITKDSIPILVFNATHQKDIPVIINYHGGGFIIPLIPEIERSLWQDSKTYGAIIFAVDYRVAPENKFPAAVNDSYNAFKWISDHAGKFGGDTSRIALMGLSAGANLVAVISQKAKKEGIAGKIKLQIMNGVAIDARPENMETSRSYQENATGYFLTKNAVYFQLNMYAPGQTNNPEVSPILTKDLRGLPPAVIINAEFDILRDDGILYASKLREAGVKVWEKCFPGEIHCLIGLQPGDKVLTVYENYIKEALAASLGKKQH